MGVTKTIIEEGSGASPSPGDTIAMEYTGWVKDTTKPDNKGAKYVPKLPICAEAACALG